MTYGVNAPMGFEPIGTLNGSSWNGATRSFNIASGYATSLFTGDPVTAATAQTGVITIAATDGPTLGIFQGCKYTDSNGVYQIKPYWPASTSVMANTVVEAILIIDPNVLYTIQANSNTGVTQAMNFRNANFVAGTGSTLTGQSGYMVDTTATTSINTIVTRNCKILGLSTPGSGAVALNTWGIGYNNVTVMINNHYLRAGIVSV